MRGSNLLTHQEAGEGSLLMVIINTTKLYTLLFMICIIVGGVFMVMHTHENAERERRFERGFAETSSLYSAALKEALELGRSDLELLLEGEFADGETQRRSLEERQEAIDRLSHIRVYPLPRRGPNRVIFEEESLVYILGEMSLGFHEGTLTMVFLGIEYNEEIEEKISMERRVFTGAFDRQQDVFIYREHIDGAFYMRFSLYAGQGSTRNLALGVIILIGGLIAGINGIIAYIKGGWGGAFIMRLPDETSKRY